MKRLGIAGVLSIVAVLLVVSPALGGLQWCPRDPIVALNGQDVQIWVSIPEVYQDAVTGPIDVQVASPHGVTQEVVFTDEGFNGYGETVEFVQRGVVQSDEMNVSLRVDVPYDRSMVEDGNLPVLLTVVLPDGSVIELEDERGTAKTSFRMPAYE
jgi:hypothetical protein